MKKIIKKLLVITVVIAMLCLMGCAGKSPAQDNAETPAAGGNTETTIEETTSAQQEEDTKETEPETESEAPLPEVESVSLANTDGDVTAKISYQVIDGLSYKELDGSGTPKIRFDYEPENIRILLSITTLNTSQLHDRIAGNSSEEPVTFGENEGYVTFDSWAAAGNIELGPQSDAVSYVMKFDIRRLDTNQAESEEQLRDFLANDAVQYILGSIELEP